MRFTPMNKEGIHFPVLFSVFMFHFAFHVNFFHVLCVMNTSGAVFTLYGLLYFSYFFSMHDQLSHPHCDGGFAG